MSEEKKKKKKPCSAGDGKKTGGTKTRLGSGSDRVFLRPKAQKKKRQKSKRTVSMWQCNKAEGSAGPNV